MKSLEISNKERNIKQRKISYLILRCIPQNNKYLKM